MHFWYKSVQAQMSSHLLDLYNFGGMHALILSLDYRGFVFLSVLKQDQKWSILNFHSLEKMQKATYPEVCLYKRVEMVNICCILQCICLGAENENEAKKLL